MFVPRLISQARVLSQTAQHVLTVCAAEAQIFQALDDSKEQTSQHKRTTKWTGVQVSAVAGGRMARDCTMGEQRHTIPSHLISVLYSFTLTLIPSTFRNTALQQHRRATNPA